MTQTRAMLARAMGMRPSEIVDMEYLRSGVVVTTHCGTKSHVGEDGTVTTPPPDDVAAAPAPPPERKPKTQEPPPAPKTSEPPEGSAAEVPSGSVAVVMEWVGDDQDRAAAALAREQLSEVPRKSLIEALQHLVGGDG